MIKQLFRYGLVTAISYSFIFIGIFVLVEYLRLIETVAYLIIITINYLLVYVANTKFVFRAKFNKTSLHRYIFVLIAFWLFNNLLFSFLVQKINLHYFLAVIINILLFGLLRFLIQKKFVFKK